MSDCPKCFEPLHNCMCGVCDEPSPEGERERLQQSLAERDKEIIAMRTAFLNDKNNDDLIIARLRGALERVKSGMSSHALVKDKFGIVAALKGIE